MPILVSYFYIKITPKLNNNRKPQTYIISSFIVSRNPGVT